MNAQWSVIPEVSEMAISHTNDELANSISQNHHYPLCIATNVTFHVAVSIETYNCNMCTALCS